MTRRNRRASPSAEATSREMEGLRLYQRGRIWWLTAYDANGRRHRVSTRQTDELAARSAGVFLTRRIAKGYRDWDGPTPRERSLPPRLRFDILTRDRFRCAYCGIAPPHAVLEVDHVVPRSKGGTDDPSNLVTSCRTCNRGKAGRELAPEHITRALDGDGPEGVADVAALVGAASFEAAKPEVVDPPPDGHSGSRP